MKILVINPNSTASMTQKIAICARQAALSDTFIEAVNPADSPAAIQGAADGTKALPHVLKLFDAKVASAHYDGAIIACFDDTGLAELKARSKIPVLGIGEAAFHAAALLGGQFSVVTTLSVSLPVIEDNLYGYGFHHHLSGLRASEIPVLSFENEPETSFDKLSAEVGAAVNEDFCRSIVLGCAGMADLAKCLSDKYKLPVIDGVASAIGFIEAIHRTMKR